MLTALPSGVQAQQQPDRTRVWAAFGLGTGASNIRVGHVVIASGLAVATGALCSDDATFGCEASSTIGFPIVLEAALRPLPILGLGLQAFLNLNTKATFGGVVLFIQLGWLP